MLVPHKAMRQATYTRYSLQCMEFSAAWVFGTCFLFSYAPSHLFLCDVASAAAA